MIVGGIGKFNSLLINRAFGFDVLTSQLLKIPLSFIGVAFYMTMAYVASLSVVRGLIPDSSLPSGIRPCLP
jgi:hypothetical protein